MSQGPISVTLHLPQVGAVDAVIVVLGTSTFLDACGCFRELRIDENYEAYLRCDEEASMHYDALVRARQEKKDRGVIVSTPS